MNKNESILELLASHLGLEKEDITESDSFQDDLRMSSIDLTDFAQKLESAGYPVSPENISDFETVEELVEFVNQEEGL